MIDPGLASTSVVAIAALFVAVAALITVICLIASFRNFVDEQRTFNKTVATVIIAGAGGDDDEAEEGEDAAGAAG